MYAIRSYYAPAVPTPTEDGLVVRYAIALVELEAIENQIRATRSRVEKTRDLLLLMRQQLDSQTVALAALAGGVSGDGSGLQVARWLPYASLDTAEEPTSGTSTMTSGTRGIVTTASPAKTSSQYSVRSVSTSGLSNNLLGTA